ncbi:Hsp20/alpha crystallin family protein [Cooperia oncophora]
MRSWSVDRFMDRVFWPRDRLMDRDFWPRDRFMDHMIYDTRRDMDHFERSIFSYWREADHSMLHVAKETYQLVNDEKKFAVSLDVSQFRPEELDVRLEGRELTIEGNAMHRSFTRKWLLPENVYLEAIRTQLDDKGHLSVEVLKRIEGPKRIYGQALKRSIPIMASLT